MSFFFRNIFCPRIAKDVLIGKLDLYLKPGQILKEYSLQIWETTSYYMDKTLHILAKDNIDNLSLVP